MVRQSHHSFPALQMLLRLVEKLGEVRMPSSCRQTRKKYMSEQVTIRSSLLISWSYREMEVASNSRMLL